MEKKGQLFRIWRDRETGELMSSRRDENSESLNMVFDSITKIVYYKFSEYHCIICENCDSHTDTKIGFLSPYISENGKYCRFIGNEIVEIP